MIVSTRGIILRTRPLTETSLIVHWLTPEFGRIATVAKGARRPKSPFLGKLDLFYTAEFSYSRSRSSDLHTLREIRLLAMHGAIREDLLRLHQAAYAAWFIEQATETDTPLSSVYDLFQGFIACLCRHLPTPPLVFALELKLLQEIGLQPDWKRTDLSAGTTKIAIALTESDWPALLRLKLARAQIAELRQFLHGFIIFHLGRLPKGRAAALAETD